MATETITGQLEDIYSRMLKRYGPQHWWPAEEPFEVMVGAILTQSAAWVNVEKAITNLKKAKALSPEALRRLSQQELATLIHPCIYYNVKAGKLKELVEWLGNQYQDDLTMLFSKSAGGLRNELLTIWGIGEETADSIILYAACKPLFVIDAYTRRIITRIGLAPEQDTYAAFQSLFMDNLSRDTQLFNEYHALLVALGKDVCRKTPLCWKCCLKTVCQYGTRIDTDKGIIYSGVDVTV